MKTKSFKDGEADELFQAFIALSSLEECYKFFGDICTPAEISAITQRYTVAKMLDKDVKYQDISNLTGASTATISRVNRSLVYGTGGYRWALNRAKKGS